MVNATIEFEDSLKFGDSAPFNLNEQFSRSSLKKRLESNPENNGKNLLEIFDKDGKLVGSAFNLVVGQGRLSILERLFNNYEYSNTHGLKVVDPTKEWISCFLNRLAFLVQLRQW